MEVTENIAVSEQLINPENLEQVFVERLPNGRFAKGHSISVGNNAGKGYQKPSRRLAVIMNEMSVKDVSELIEHEGFKNLSCIDAAIVKRAKAAADGDRVDAEFAFDRLEGKATNKTELTGKDGKPITTVNANADVTDLLMEIADDLKDEK